MAQFTKVIGGWRFDVAGRSFVAHRNEAGFAGRQWEVAELDGTGLKNGGFSTDMLVTRDAAVAAARQFCISQAKLVESRLAFGQIVRIVNEFGVTVEGEIVSVEQAGATNERRIYSIATATSTKPVRVPSLYVRSFEILKADATVPAEATIVDEIALAERGERYAFVTRLGSHFEATFVEAEPMRQPDRRISLANATITLLATDDDGIATLPVAGLASMKLVAPKSVDEPHRAKAIALVEEAFRKLQDPTTTSDELVGVEQILHEATNATHWAAVPFGPALDRALGVVKFAAVGDTVRSLDAQRVTGTVIDRNESHVAFRTDLGVTSRAHGAYEIIRRA
jgi:hypothetical protein